MKGGEGGGGGFRDFTNENLIIQRENVPQVRRVRLPDGMLSEPKEIGPSGEDCQERRKGGGMKWSPTWRGHIRAPPGPQRRERGERKGNSNPVFQKRRRASPDEETHRKKGILRERKTRFVPLPGGLKEEKEKLVDSDEQRVKIPVKL